MTSLFSRFALYVTSCPLSKNCDTNRSMPPTLGIYGASCLNGFVRNQRGPNDNEAARTVSFNCHGSSGFNSICQRFAGNAKLRPAFRTPGMDMRAGELHV